MFDELEGGRLSSGASSSTAVGSSCWHACRDARELHIRLVIAVRGFLNLGLPPASVKGLK